MQTKSILLTALAACASTASAASTGYAKVANKCSFPVYLWSATPTATGSQQASTLDAHNGTYKEKYLALQTGGVALKISLSDDAASLYDGSPLTQDQYTLDGATVWYSLADTGGDPFLGHKVTLVPTGGGQSIEWSNGTGASQILNTASSNNLTLTLCA